MKFLYEWIGDTKKTIDTLGAITFLVYISLLLISYFKVQLSHISWTFLMSLLIILPFGILVSIITNNEIFKKVTSTLWSKSLISIGLVVHTAMSNVWASTLINEIYGVAANHFGITQIFLTMVYFVITIMKTIFSGLFISIIAIGFLPLWYVMFFENQFKSKVYKVVYFFIIMSFVAGTYTIIGLFDRDIKIFAERAALWGDFYPINKCTEDLGKNSGVIFLSANKVLTAVPLVDNENKVHWDYSIKQCM